jgi:hypothetical protein
MIGVNNNLLSCMIISFHELGRFITHQTSTVYNYRVYLDYSFKLKLSARATVISATPVDTATAAVTSGKAVS